MSQVILESGHRVRAETYGDQTSLTIEVTEREDTGNYKIVLQNEAGEATASIKVKVVGKNSAKLLIQKVIHRIVNLFPEALIKGCVVYRHS